MKIEATQFTPAEFSQFESMTNLEIADLEKKRPGRYAGFKFFAEQAKADKAIAKDLASKNIQRIRVMKEKEDPSKLSLDITYKHPKVVHKQAMEKKAPARSVWPIIISDPRRELCALAQKGADSAREQGKERLAKSFEVIRDEIQTSDLTYDAAIGIREFLLKDVVIGMKEMNAWSDYLQAFLLIYAVTARTMEKERDKAKALGILDALMR